MQSEKHRNKILGEPLNLYPALFSAAQPAHPACYRSTPAQPVYHFGRSSPHLPEWCGCPISPHLALSMDAAQMVPDGLFGQAYADGTSRATGPEVTSAIIRFPRRDSRDSTLLPSPRPRSRLRRHRPGHSVSQCRPPVAPAKPTGHNRDGQQLDARLDREPPTPWATPGPYSKRTSSLERTSWDSRISRASGKERKADPAPRGPTKAIGNNAAENSPAGVVWVFGTALPAHTHEVTSKPVTISLPGDFHAFEHRQAYSSRISEYAVGRRRLRGTSATRRRQRWMTSGTRRETTAGQGRLATGSRMATHST